MALDPGTYKTTIWCGATWERTFTWRVDGTLVNWTGYTAKLQVKQYLNDASVLTLTSGSGITLGGSAGTIALVMSSALTGAVTPGSYLYDLEVTNGTVTYRVLEGKLQFDGQVTI
jgi:hypothetical protein